MWGDEEGERENERVSALCESSSSTVCLLCLLVTLLEEEEVMS